MSDITRTDNNIPEVRLSHIIEFCGWLSIVTLVSGYIWIRTILWMEDIRVVDHFTASDYISYGASPFLVFVVGQFMFNFYNVISDKVDRTKKFSLYLTAALLLLSILVSSALTIIRYMSGLPILTFPYMFQIVSGFGFAMTIPIFLLVTTYVVPFRLSFLSVALIIAGVSWTQTAYYAARFAMDNKISDADLAHPIVYQFNETKYSSDKWLSLLATERYYYFLEP
ncbi:hypothetical protein GGE67_003273 [Rhizobium leucaenae]|nr:hypothetical protein [Rhizobium leucaenae]